MRPFPQRLVPGTVRLRTAIGVAFTLILMLSAGGLVWLDHRATYRLLRRQVDKQFDIVAEGVTARVAVQFDSADAVLDTLAMSPPPLGEPERTGVVLARVLADLRRTSPAVRSLITAGADGRSVLAEHVGHPPGRKPGPIAYHLRASEVTAGRSSEVETDLGADFDVLSRTEKPTRSYDPRNRPWYTLAAGTPEAVTTPRYLFGSGDHYGFTMSRRAEADPGQVFGLDVRLDSLSNSLRHALAFPGEHVAIFDRTGTLLGDSDGLALVDPLGSGARGATPGEPGLALDEAAYAAYRSDPRPHNIALEVGGRGVYLSLAPFAVNGAGMVVASSVPARLFEAPAARLLLWSLLAQAALVGVAGVLVTAASRVLSDPIGKLAADVERIIAFDFPERPRGTSRIREIRRLLAAVDLLELTLKALSTYLPRHFVRDFLDRRAVPTLGGGRARVAVLFTDIEGFTGIAEATAPDELMLQLSRYHSVISDEVLASGGTLDKFIGDGVMAFWPLPEGGPGRAADACRTVLRTRARIATLNAEFEAEGRRPFRTRFGLHAGDAMVGSIGVAERMNYTALGHTVNVAARIEQLNKAYGTRVLVSAALREAAGDGFRFRHVDAAAVRGLQAPVEVYELLSEAAGEPAVSPPRDLL